jgi:DNA transformation protein
MPYWTAPEEAIDDPDSMRPWAKMAYDAGLRAKKPNKKR